MNQFKLNNINPSMKRIKNIFIFTFLFIFGGFFTSCEDVIEVNVEQQQVKLVVDAFVNNMDTVQTIRLTQSIPYFAK